MYLKVRLLFPIFIVFSCAPTLNPWYSEGEDNPESITANTASSDKNLKTSRPQDTLSHTEYLWHAIKEYDSEHFPLYFSEDLKKIYSQEKTKEFFFHLKEDFGAFIKLQATSINSPTQAVSELLFERGVLQMSVTIAEKNAGQVMALGFMPVIRTPQIAKSSVSLAAPLHRQALVLWGGDSLELNRHYGNLWQRFGIDFTIVDEKGRFRKNLAASNTDFFCFGEKVFSPAAGEIVEVIDGVHDNKPGVANQYVVLGNSITIKMNKEEYLVIGHLKRQSIKIKLGDKIKDGQWIASCGNSGNSQQPQVHVHVQDAPYFSEGIGLKSFYKKIHVIRRDGSQEQPALYAPVKGDVLLYDKVPAKNPSRKKK